jgi:hypothetical protein
LKETLSASLRPFGPLDAFFLSHSLWFAYGLRFLRCPVQKREPKIFERRSSPVQKPKVFERRRKKIFDFCKAKVLQKTYGFLTEGVRRRRPKMSTGSLF